MELTVRLSYARRRMDQGIGRGRGQGRGRGRGRARGKGEQPGAVEPTLEIREEFEEEIGEKAPAEFLEARGHGVPQPPPMPPTDPFRMSLLIRDLKKLGVKTFEGKVDHMKADRWIRNLENYFKIWV
ncbi:unnamed protein product [Prunus armeniaca]|uniref:Uncharacterized protein n=1 Tax=Prunus armeniaca TaxID=36596 RepID=A0A6J5URU2_PRUAR|nr:unnamed protein product [Prunus armeniaca]